MVLALDNELAILLNKIASHSPSLNQFERFVSDNNLIKCGVFMVTTWWLWFRNDKNSEPAIRNRQVIVGILLGCLVAMFCTRMLTHAFPHRTRPIYNTELHLVSLFAKPPGVDTSTSFPSDHATLFCALATGFFFLSKRLGAAAMLYTVLFVCFPRAYLGYHYLSDLVMGGLIGVVVACLANHPYGGLELGRRTHVRVVLVSTCFVRIFSLVLHLEPHARDVGDYNSSGVHPVH